MSLGDKCLIFDTV